MWKRVSYLMLGMGAALAALFAMMSATQAGTDSMAGDFVPIGGGYESATLRLFAERALAQDSDNAVKIFVLPITFASDPYTITLAERADNLAAATNRRNQVFNACQAVVPGGVSCDVQLLDIQIRSDTFITPTVGLIDDTTDGIFILGGDQTIAMQVAANTPLEAAIIAAHENGAVIGGTSAGAAVQSRYMIGGYSSWGQPWYGLELGALDLWYDEALTSTYRGLANGLDLAIIDQHFLERGRMGRLLQAVFYKPAGPKLGVGVDWGSSVAIAHGHLLTQTAGWYAAVVLDQETYNAALGAEHKGPYDTLSMQNVAFHLLPRGPYGYDLLSQQPLAHGAPAAAPDISGRNFDFLHLPLDAGTLFITGDIGNDSEGETTQRFALAAQAAVSPTLIIATGFADEAAAIAEAAYWAGVLHGLGVTETTQTVFGFGATTTETLRAQIETAGAIFITGNDQVEMADIVAELRQAEIHLLLRQRLEAGAPLLFDNAAAAAVGERMSREPTPTGATLIFQASDSFEAGYIETSEGLAIMSGAIFEPRVMYDYLYGRLASHIYERPDLVAVGVERGTALRLTPAGAEVLGQSAVWIMDGRYATLLDEGENGIIAANWLLLDTYAPGDHLWLAPLDEAIALYLPIVVKD